MDENTLKIIQQSLLFQNMAAEEQSSLLREINSLAEDKLTSFLEAFQKAEEKMQQVKSQNSLDINKNEEKLKSLQLQVKVLKAKKLKLDEEDEAEKSKKNAEELLKQLNA